MAKMTRKVFFVIMLCAAMLAAAGCDTLAKKGLTPTQTPSKPPVPAPPVADEPAGEPEEVFDKTPSGYLASRVAEFDRAIYVYRDGADVANRFPRQVWMGSEDSADVPAMDSMAEGMDGSTAICAMLDFEKHNWGGYYFVPPSREDMGIVSVLASTEAQDEDETSPLTENLTGAARLTFYVRGEHGGEKVEFFIGGQGWDGWKPAAFADSTQKISIGSAILTQEWTRYEIPLDGVNLSAISGGFGWVANDKNNPDVEELTFYLDNIRYEFPEKLDKSILLTSYAPAMPGTDNAIIYDNALTAIALSRAGQQARAAQIADGIVALCSQGKWFSTTGNLAWAMLALCELAENTTGPAQTNYIDTAQKIAGVILTFHSNSGKGGFEAGYEYLGSDLARAYYKSTEHNIDLVAAFSRLAALCSEDAEAAALYTGEAEHARDFVLTMIDKNLGCIYTGTSANGTTINRDVVPLDCQTWAILTLGDALTPEQKEAAMAYVELKMRVKDTEGYDFNTDRDGVWFEGTAQAALAYKALGDQERYETIVAYLKENEKADGSIAAADRDNVTTGFFIIGTGLPWRYGNQVHIGATAWTSFAEAGENPFVAK